MGVWTPRLLDWELRKTGSRFHEDHAGKPRCTAFTIEFSLDEGIQFAGSFCLPENVKDGCPERTFSFCKGGGSSMINSNPSGCIRLEAKS